MAQKVIIAYIPAIHQGYRRFFEAHPEHRTLYLLGRDVTNGFRELQKEIRALDPVLACQLLLGWGIFDEIEIIDKDTLDLLADNDIDIVMPDEDISHALRERHFPDKSVAFSPIFLRWDRRRSNERRDIEPEALVSEDELAAMMLQRAFKEGAKSSNIWRGVGAVLARKGEVIVYSNNRPLPSQHTPWIDGDVRANFNRGVGIEMSVDQHAEACAIADAARRGIALEDADLYVTDFPCPPCAMLIAYSGIKRLYYVKGYTVLDGQRILQLNDVKIYKVKMPLPGDNDERHVPYPENDTS